MVAETCNEKYCTYIIFLISYFYCIQFQIFQRNMMAGAVVYQSRYGSTRQYAEWLSQSLQMELFSLNEMKDKNIAQFSEIVFCSPVYYGKILLSRYIKKTWNLFKGKKLYLLVVAGVDENAKEDIQNMINLNFKPIILSRLKWFYLGGRMELERLKLMEKFIVKRLAKIIEDEKERDKLQNGYDMIERKKLDPVIATIRGEI